MATWPCPPARTRRHLAGSSERCPWVPRITFPTSADDHGQLQPMLAQTQENLLAAGIAAKVGVLLADAGYRSEENLLCEGPELLIATVKDAKQHRAARDAKP